MQDVGGKEDAEFSEDDLILGWREWLVESLGHCQPIRINFLCAGYSCLLPKVNLIISERREPTSMERVRNAIMRAG